MSGSILQSAKQLHFHCSHSEMRAVGALCNDRCGWEEVTEWKADISVLWWHPI